MLNFENMDIGVGISLLSHLYAELWWGNFYPPLPGYGDWPEQLKNSVSLQGLTWHTKGWTSVAADTESSERRTRRS